MPKDKDGNFHSAHGKPSAPDKSEGTGMQATPREEMNEYNRLTDEYMDGSNEVADNVREMNPNRNTEGEDAPYRQKEPNPMRDRTLKERDDERDTSPEIRELPVPMAKGLFKELASYQNEHCVTLLLNTHQSGVEVNENQDAISFKNAVKKAEQLLKERGTDDTTIQRMLSPAFGLINDTLFWKNMTIGFAVFISPERFDYMKLNKQPGDRVVVEKTFYVTPLLRLILDDTHYYVLDLSKGGNRFFKGNKFGLEEMKIENMPGSIMDEISDRGVSIVYRYDGQSSMHGYGDASVEDDVYLRNYLKRIDTAVTRQLQDRETPLILSGAQPVTTMFRNESSFKTIAAETLAGNNQHKGEHELFKEVLPIAEKFI